MTRSRLIAATLTAILAAGIVALTPPAGADLGPIDCTTTRPDAPPLAGCPLRPGIPWTGPTVTTVFDCATIGPGDPPIDPAVCPSTTTAATAPPRPLPTGTVPAVVVIERATVAPEPEPEPEPAVDEAPAMDPDTAQLVTLGLLIAQLAAHH